MSNSDLHAAVIGASGMADVLERSGRFETVWRFDSISALKNGIGSLSAVATNKITFLFADNAPSGDADITLSDLIRRLTSRSYRVVILECSPNARLIVDTNPSAGLIPHPISCNIVLGALSERGAGVIPPVEEPWAYQTLDPSNQLSLSSQPVAVSNPLSDLDDVFGDVFNGLAPVTGNSSGSTQYSEPSPQPIQEPSVASGWEQTPSQPTQEPSFAPSPQPIQEPSVASGWEQTPSQPTQEPSFTPSPQPIQEPSVAPGWEQTPSQPTQPPVSAPVASGWEQTPSQPSQPPVSAPVASGWEQTPSQPSQPPVSAPNWSTSPSQPSNTWDQNPASPAAWGQAAPATPASAPNWGSNQPQASWGADQSRPSPAPAGVVGGRRGIVISICVAKGGAGKSSLTVNMGVWLALRLSQTGRKVCIVDANWQQADVGKQIGAHSPNIYDLALAPQHINPTDIYRHLLEKPEWNTHFLLGPARPDQANPTWITPQLYSRSIDALKQEFDYIFVDTPVAEPHHSLFSNFILTKSDFLLVPVNPSWKTIYNADTWLDGITKNTSSATGGGFPKNRIGIVLNRAEEDVNFDEETVVRELSSWQYLGKIPDSKEWRRAENNGELIATRNLPEISSAFTSILHRITGEDVLTAIATQPTASRKKGLWGRRK